MWFEILCMRELLSLCANQPANLRYWSGGLRSGGLGVTVCSLKGQEQTTTVEEHSLKCLAERATRHGRSLSSSSGRLVASLHSAPGGGEDELQLSHCGYSPGQGMRGGGGGLCWDG